MLLRRLLQLRGQRLLALLPLGHLGSDHLALAGLVGLLLFKAGEVLDGGGAGEQLILGGHRVEQIPGLRGGLPEGLERLLRLLLTGLWFGQQHGLGLHQGGGQLFAGGLAQFGNDPGEEGGGGLLRGLLELLDGLGGLGRGGGDLLLNLGG